MAKWMQEPPELTHAGLDILGLVPGFGEYFDFGNGLLYVSEGRHGEAILSGLGMIPVAGWIPTGIKLGTKAPKLISKGSKACRTNSFTGDTRVLMADGTTKRIDQIRVGDWVRTTDPKTGATTSQLVTATIVSVGTKRLVNISIESQRPLKLSNAWR